jgi:hypothetical protein
MRPLWTRTAAAMAAVLVACSPSPRSIDGILADHSVSPTTATVELGLPVGREWREPVGLSPLREISGVES